MCVSLLATGTRHTHGSCGAPVWFHGRVDPTPPFFVFDGDCGFCTKWASWLRRRLPPDVRFVAYQDVDDLGAYGLTEQGVETASYWVDERGTPHRGARSFAHVLRQGDRPWAAIGALLDAPLIGLAADRLYRVIARNRHRLPAPEGHASRRSRRP